MVLARMASSVQRICQLAHLCPRVSSIVSLVLGGMAQSGSVMLSDIIRPQVHNRAELHAREQQVSRSLALDDSLDQLHQAYLTLAQPHVAEMPFYSVDMSDISKPSGRKFELLDVVRDGSAKPRSHFSVPVPDRLKSCKPTRLLARRKNSFPIRRRPGAAMAPCSGQSHPQRDRDLLKGIPLKQCSVLCQEKDSPILLCCLPEITIPLAGKSPRLVICQQQRSTEDCPINRHSLAIKHVSRPGLKKPGYWVISIEAGNGEGIHIPLDCHVFSTLDDKYAELGHNPWMTIQQQRIQQILTIGGQHAIWLFDRGYDSNEWLCWAHKHLPQTVQRIKTNRKVHPGTKDKPAQSVRSLGESLKRPYTTWGRRVNHSTHEEETVAITFNYVPVVMKGIEHSLYLLVANTGRRNLLYLITDRAPVSEKQAASWVRSYFERWGNEEVTRCLGQLTGLENIRVRSMKSIRRLVMMAMIAVGLVALLEVMHPAVARGLLGRSKEFIARVRYKTYRLWRIVQSRLTQVCTRRSVPLWDYLLE